jgi:hypothetical protein
MAQLIQCLRGNGKVLSGGRTIENVRYVVNIYRTAGIQIEFLSGPPSREPASESIALEISPPVQAASGVLLTLHLDDGSRLNFWAAGGEYTAYGGLH